MTPGPWTAIETVDEVLVGTEDAKLICDMEVGYHFTKEECAANAKAIAKVPEMVALLKRVAQYDHVCYEEDGTTSVIIGKHMEDARVLLEEIEKGEG
jgi:hypothetical protein